MRTTYCVKRIWLKKLTSKIGRRHQERGVLGDDSRIVDQNVDRAPVGPHGADGARHGGRIGHVEEHRTHRNPVPPGDVRHVRNEISRLFARASPHVRPIAGKRLDYRAAYAPVRSGDHCILSVEQTHVVTSHPLSATTSPPNRNRPTRCRCPWRIPRQPRGQRHARRETELSHAASPRQRRSR